MLKELDGSRQCISISIDCAYVQADKMGVYYLYSTDYNGHPAYQHKSGLDFLYFAEGNAWVIGAKVGIQLHD